VKQSGKVRVVDDFSEGVINAALPASETVPPSDLDCIASAVRAHMAGLLGEAVAGKGPAKVHADFVDSALRGRMFDLSRAYRQLARAPAHASLTVIV